MAIIVSALLLALLCTGTVIAALEVRKRQQRMFERQQNERIERDEQRQLPTRTEQPRQRPAPRQRQEIVPDRSAADVYVSWCAGRLAELAEEHHAKHQKLTAESIDIATRLRTAASEQRDFELVKGVVETLRQTRARVLEHAFSALVAREAVARIEVTEYGWLVVTTPLMMKQAEEIHALGKMEIHLDHFGRVRLFNQTNRPVVCGLIYDHPLVRDGEPLLPAATRCQLALSVGKKRIDEAFDALFIFLTQIPETTLVPASMWHKEIQHEKILVPRF